jgi:hypothetical protein
MSTIYGGNGGLEATANTGIPTLGQIDAAVAKNPHDGLLLYYKLDEASTPSVDSVALDGQLNMDLNWNGTSQAPGKVGNSLLSTALQQYAGTTGAFDSLLGQIGSRSVFCWVYLVHAVASGYVAEIFGLRGSSACLRLVVYETGGNNRLRFQCTTSGTSWQYSFNHTTNLSTGTWYFVAAVYDQSAAKVTLYVDTTAVSMAAGFSTISSSVTDVSIGDRSDGESGKQWRVDELGFAGRALSAAELEAIRRNGNGTGYLQVPDTEQGASLPFGFQSSGVTVANTTTETSLVGTPNSGSATFPANSLKLYGGGRLNLKVSMAYIAGETFTIRVKVGGTTLLEHTTVPGAALASTIIPFVDTDIQCESAGTDGWCRAFYVTSVTLPNPTAYSGTGVVNTTIANAVDLTWQWATANAGNTVKVLSLTGVED